MKKITIILCVAVASLCLVLLGVRANENLRRISLPTSKMLILPVPGFIARTNSFPTTIALSPNGRYAAFLNQGYGTQESGVRQSIAILDLSNNRLRDIPDDRLRGDEKSPRQSYLLLAHFGKDGVPESVIPRINQERLAEMVGTTRSRVSFFMNRFRKLGFINYDAASGLQVHSSLLNVVLHD